MVARALWVVTIALLLFPVDMQLLGCKGWLGGHF